MGFPIPGLRQQQRTIHDQRWQDLGGTELRPSQPKWLYDVRRIRLWFELEQLWPFLGQQRLWNIQAIGRLQRNVDSVETMTAMPVFKAPARLSYGAGEPQLCPARSGIAAHYDPSL